MNRLLFEFLQGILIGAAGILPGISGAAMAVVFGLYEEITGVLAHPVREIKNFLRTHWSLCLGGLAGFVLLAFVLERFFSDYATVFVFLFSGFILGTLPGLYREAKKDGIGAAQIISFSIAMGIMLVLAFIRFRYADLFVKSAESAESVSRALSIPGIWVIAGGIIAIGSLIPGISASFIFIAIGLYIPLLEAVGELNILIGLQIVAGILITVILFARLVHWLYRRFTGTMTFIVLGFTIGSLVLAFPGIPQGTNILLCIILVIVGFFLSYFLEKKEIK
ncbi:DUF368 domain-containing protein [Brucepastera parasyntrophica]|uniref:DUF368 domain-containing protein n=1 Tax=Brucepastera parasyntrophica TaxID=2880008 RepID=UPI00210A9270|nr:DUF368 domain-containing protein [Brucepastera parasyntrophica]ULQ59154.1 DUF368 domain-containing protein [Brucepastera parasyntrophica]